MNIGERDTHVYDQNNKALTFNQQKQSGRCDAVKYNTWIVFLKLRLEKKKKIMILAHGSVSIHHSKDFTILVLTKA